MPYDRFPTATLERYRDIVDDWSAFADASHRPEPTALRTRLRLIDPTELRSALELQGFSLDPIPGIPSYFHLDSGPGSVAQTMEHWLGLFHIQQLVMALPSLALAPGPGERVLDLCAAPGGKTVHLSELMDERGPLVAVDPKEKRLRGLMANVFRLGVPNVLVIAADGRELPGGALFDRVLVDAPCSAEGNYRRQQGRLPVRTADFVEYVTELQWQLLSRAVELTRPGGTLVYSTCTFAPEENEAIVDRALRELPVEIEPISLELPHAPGVVEWDGLRFADEVGLSWRVYPHHLDSGGMFMARLRRTGSPTEGGGRSVTGWTEVPQEFPDEPADGPGRARLHAALDELRSKYGFGADFLDRLGWMIRGDNIWAHTARVWPVDGWREEGHGGWRVVSLGLRGTRYDSAGREVPSNQFLQRFGTELSPGRKLEVDSGELLRLLAGGSVERPDSPPGPVAIFYDGRPLGRGMVGRGGVRSEIPRVQARRLRALLEG